jgi:hypothetical protein
MNLLEETKNEITRIGKTIEDIDFINITDEVEKFQNYEKAKYFSTDFDGFVKFCARFRNYNNGYGSAEVPMNTVVVFKDGTWLERAEYDGSEWWEYRQIPRKITKESK